MRFDTRIGWLLLGCVVGFILGYFARSLREIREKLNEVDKHVTSIKRKDDGFLENSLSTNLALLFVVLLTVYASVQSQRSSNKTSDTADQVKHVSTCTQQYLTKTIAALNARTQYSLEQNASNVNLQKAQAEFLGRFTLNKPVSQKEGAVALNTYFTALTHFLSLSGKTTSAIATNPFPTTQEFSACLDSS